MTMLQAEQVSFSYQGKHETVHAVKDFNYDFEPGSFYAIVGKSGSGKTTLLSLLAGLELPTQGQVAFQGDTTTQMDCDRFRRDHAAVIYQNFNLFPQLTAQENVMYPLRLQKVDRQEATQRAQEALAQVGLSPTQWRRYPSHLSGGDNSVWPLPARWPSAVRSFWPTSLLETWMKRIPRASPTCCCAWPMSRIGVSSWSHMIDPLPPGPMPCWSCGMGVCCNKNRPMRNNP